MGFLDDLLRGAQNNASRIGGNYVQQVKEQSKYPFFNKDNTPVDWATRKVPEQFRTRGVAEGLQSLTNPVLMDPYLSPILQPLVSEARVAVSRSPLNPVNNLARGVLGLPQTVNRMPRQKQPFGSSEAFWNQE